MIYSSHAPLTRLKPVNQDPLEAVGLPSKGDTSLNSTKAQEDYFGLLRTRCRVQRISADSENIFECTESAHSVLEQKLASLVIQKVTQSEDQQFATVLGAMRKLRESLVATKRLDNLTREVYLFIIRSTIRLQQHEAYHPPLLSAIRAPDLARLFTMDEYMELVRYAALDLAGRQNASREAFEMAWHCHIFPQQYEMIARKDKVHKSTRAQNLALKKVLQSAVRNDLRQYHVHKRNLSINEKVLLWPLDQRLNTQAVACLSRGYFMARVSFVEHMLNLSWANDEQKKDRGIFEATRSWQVDGEKLVFRHPRASRAKIDTARPATTYV